MNIKDILSIAGKPGLYRLVTQSRNSIIVESLDSGKRIPISASQKISSLEEISIYTFSADVPLKDVFDKIYATTSGNEAVNHKASGAELHNFMSSVLPDYDIDRVYDSDLRKLFQWYNTLLRIGRFNEEKTTDKVEEKSSPAAKKKAKPPVELTNNGEGEADVSTAQ